MMENYKAEQALKGMMKNNRDVGHALGLEREKEAVIGIMGKLGIKKDVSNLKGYQQKEFLGRIDRAKNLGFYAKKAIHGALEVKKPEVEKSKISVGENRHTRYDEIMNKRNNNKQLGTYKNSLVQDFSASNKNIHAASELLGNSKKETIGHNKSHFPQSIDEKNNDIKNVLKRIQS